MIKLFEKYNNVKIIHDFFDRLHKFIIDLDFIGVKKDNSQISIGVNASFFNIEYYTTQGSVSDTIEMCYALDTYKILDFYLISKFELFYNINNNFDIHMIEIDDVKNLNKIVFSKEEYEIFKDSERFGL